MTARPPQGAQLVPGVTEPMAALFSAREEAASAYDEMAASLEAEGRASQLLRDTAARIRAGYGDDRHPLVAAALSRLPGALLT